MFDFFSNFLLGIFGVICSIVGCSDDPSLVPPLPGL